VKHSRQITPEHMEQLLEAIASFEAPGEGHGFLQALCDTGFDIPAALYTAVEARVTELGGKARG